MNTTVRIKASQIYKDWHVIDAAGRPLGRVATEAATLLRGKHKPTYEPHLDDGDFVVVINAAQVRVSGRKSSQIKYYTHSGYPGGLKTRSYEEQLARFPERILERAIWGMLPGGPLGEAMYRHLKVYKGPNHPHQSQITGSERARDARPAVTAPAPARPARLRPLSVPDLLPEPVARVAPPAAPKPKPAPAPARPTVRKAKAPTETAASEATGIPVAEVVAEPVAEATMVESVPKKAATRKKAAAVAPAETEAMKPRAPRKKAAGPTAEASAEPAAEAKKPARRRAAKTEE
ncbi:MAG: 50S ribosomal protein L13 [Anaerolinea sp.]|nr:50S ribosomal protein L13 [Anaerolinea sp.]